MQGPPNRASASQASAALAHRSPISNPHAGRIRADTDQTPPPPPPVECPHQHPYYVRIQCQMGAHDSTTHAAYDRGMGAIIWHHQEE